MNVIHKTIPRHTDENIPLDQVFEFYFMIDMNLNTIKEEHIILLNLTERKVESVRFDYNRRVLKVRPVNKLSPNNHYQIQIVGGNDGIKDIIGRQMAQTYELEFYTKDVDSIKPPKILSPTDVSAISKPATIVLESNDKVEYYEVQISQSNTFANLLWPTNDEKVYSLLNTEVTPDIAYKTGLYYLRVRSVSETGEKSSWSQVIRYFYEGEPVIRQPDEEEVPELDPIEQIVESFTSAKKVILQPSTKLIDEASQLASLQNVFLNQEINANASILVKATSPKDGSVNNTVSTFNQTNKKQIVIEFNENIDPSTVNSSNCYVVSERN
ncbi:Ig-like domain-containing protein [Bacillus sp. ILBB4]|nr:Ig-like domain-containing protein [Bacillus sp. ILBB4]